MFTSSTVSTFLHIETQQTNDISSFVSMGTSRPALYQVLHDEIGFNSNEIQQLTYWVCRGILLLLESNNARLFF